MFLSYKGAGNDNKNTELEAFLGKEFSVEQFLREEKEGSQDKTMGHGHTKSVTQ